MNTFLVGHRGVGKTSLLRRISKQFPELNCFDLDEEVIKRSHKSIDEIFNSLGESHFRKLEKEVFAEIVKDNKGAWVALGAGFDGILPRPSRVIWVKRSSDDFGRVFFNRPRLSPQSTSPLLEYHERRGAREQRFRELADEVYLMPEGPMRNSPEEFQVLKLQSFEAKGLVTAIPETDEGKFRKQIELLKSYCPEAIEVRDDLLTPRQREMVLEIVPENQILWSLRDPAVKLWPNKIQKVDWALEIGREFPEDIAILSIHQREHDLCEFLKSLPIKTKAHLKLAIEINSFEELRMAHEWRMEAPHLRSFLPRSKDGRWKWYRQLFGRSQQISFWRLDQGSALDQPTLFEWLESYSRSDQFSAVLGDPVDHSWTPREQSLFFRQYKIPVVKIKMARSEFTDSNLSYLRSMGLRYAAVTAPLKDLAAQLKGTSTPAVERFHAANTLLWNDEWIKHNTDYDGLKALLEGNSLENVYVWGGGGTQQVLKSILPSATYFKARTGEVENGKVPLNLSPKLLVWASSETDLNKVNWPPESWRPETVVDLNYFSHSLGAEYAMRVGANYLSGDKMFFAQAQGQREFWKKHLTENEIVGE